MRDGTNYDSRRGNGCGTPPANPVPPAANFGDYVGWGIPYGSMGSGPIMTAMAGWNNHRTEYISRAQQGIPGGFHTTCTWDRIISKPTTPAMIVLNSFNEFAEETGPQPTDTTTGQAPTEAGPAPGFYWNLTTQKIAAYRQAP